MESADALIRGLDTDRTVDLTAPQWAAVRSAFEEIEAHATGMGNDLLVLRGPNGGWFALESPSEGQYVLRRLADRDAVQRFVARRLEQVERMWDGCGCRIDYHD